MAQVIIEYLGEKIFIQCNENKSMKNIFQKISQKLSVDINSLFFLYSGNKIDQDLSFYQLANKGDKERKCMSIIAYQSELKDYDKNFKQLICSECGKNVKMKFHEYKIKLYPCENDHNENIILLNEYEKYQKLYSNNLKCDICMNKNDEEENQVFYCENCKKNLSLICKKDHENFHKLIDNKNFNYIYREHNINYNSYCKNCDKNLFYLCAQSHENHAKVLFEKILPNLDEHLKKIRILRNGINEFINEIKEIKILIRLNLKLILIINLQI